MNSHEYLKKNKVDPDSYELKHNNNIQKADTAKKNQKLYRKNTK